MPFPIIRRKERNQRKMRDWRKRIPKDPYKIRIVDALQATGNMSRLATILGISRSALSQWFPPYRYSPYMPLKSVRVLLKNTEVMQKIERIKISGPE